MSNVTPSAFARAAVARLGLLMLAAAPLATAPLTGTARAADVAAGGTPYTGMPPAFAGGGYWAPSIPLRPAPTRFDIYGYPILGPGLVGRPPPHAIGVGCPPALEPAYDPDGNLAGYAPLQYCR